MAKVTMDRQTFIDRFSLFPTDGSRWYKVTELPDGGLEIVPYGFRTSSNLLPAVQMCRAAQIVKTHPELVSCDIKTDEDHLLVVARHEDYTKIRVLFSRSL